MHVKGRIHQDSVHLQVFEALCKDWIEVLAPNVSMFRNMRNRKLYGLHIEAKQVL